MGGEVVKWRGVDGVDGGVREFGGYVFGLVNAVRSKFGSKPVVLD